MYTHTNIHMYIYIYIYRLPWCSAVKNLPAIQGTQIRSLGQEDPLKEGMTTHSSILAGKIPWREEPGMGSHRVGHD